MIYRTEDPENCMCASSTAGHYLPNKGPRKLYVLYVPGCTYGLLIVLYKQYDNTPGTSIGRLERRNFRYTRYFTSNQPTRKPSCALLTLLVLSRWGGVPTYDTSMYLVFVLHEVILYCTRYACMATAVPGFMVIWPLSPLRMICTSSPFYPT